jgi:hypothetical protein
MVVGAAVLLAHCTGAKTAVVFIIDLLESDSGYFNGIGTCCKAFLYQGVGTNERH